ncbi:hypothetical protein AKJ16_DCAP08851 [Drosera capensis]
MTVSGILSDKKMSSRRPKSPGWAAFDLQQKQKNQIAEPQSYKEPYPLLPTTVPSLEPRRDIPKHSDFLPKSFSSAILPSANHPKFGGNSTSNKPSGSGNKVLHQEKDGSIFSRLKMRYNWADDELIKDILAAVGDDFEKASLSLDAMVTTGSKEEFEDAYLAGLNYGLEDFACFNKTVSADRNEPEEKARVSSASGSVPEASVRDLTMKDSELHEETKFMHGSSTYAPVEPEWEEDDVYLSHHKDAIKLMRAAARHARAASNSFLVGDHYSARQFSLKAREDWAGAEKLNTKAASKILRIRNENNGKWKLDLHGLHVAEAVEALHERLQLIETRLSKNGVAHPSDTRLKEETVIASSRNIRADVEKSNEHTVVRQSPILLEVITGRGNHSHGGAALPSAVRSFLAEKGYRFDETRPGVIMVRPKFRHG